MIVKSSEFQNSVGKYMRIAEKEDVIITKNGRPFMRLVPTKNETPLLDEIIELTGKISSSKNLDVSDRELRNERLIKYE